MQNKQILNTDSCQECQVSNVNFRIVFDVYSSELMFRTLAPSQRIIGYI